MLCQSPWRPSISFCTNWEHHLPKGYNATMLIALGVIRCVYYFVENPERSSIAVHPWFVFMMSNPRLFGMQRTFWWGKHNVVKCFNKCWSRRYIYIYMWIYYKYIMLILIYIYMKKNHFTSLVCSSAFLHTPDPCLLPLLQVDGLLWCLEPKAPAWTVECGLGGETLHPHDFRTEETDCWASPIPWTRNGSQNSFQTWWKNSCDTRTGVRDKWLYMYRMWEFKCIRMQPWLGKMIQTTPQSRLKTLSFPLPVTPYH